MEINEMNNILYKELKNENDLLMLNIEKKNIKIQELEKNESSEKGKNMKHELLKDDKNSQEESYKIVNSKNYQIIQKVKKIIKVDEKLNGINKNKPKIAIIIDKEGWAFDNSAKEIKRNLSKFFNVDIISADIFNGNAVKLFIYVKDYDLVFFMWRGIISWLYSEYSRDYICKLGFDFEEFVKEFIKEKNILTGVYDHLFIDSEQERTEFILENVKDYIVCSEKLQKIYQHFSKKPNKVISDGVNLEMFYLKNNNKFNNIENRILTVGWTGNSNFTDEIDDDLKGIKKVIKPAIEELKEEGYKIELEVADRNIKMIPHDQMINYYNKLDVYICASRTEGHPAPILEAMACGVPVISTDVGIVPELFGEKQKKYIIERTKEDLKNKIIEVYNRRTILKELSKENLQQIKKWTWKKQSLMYKKFFEDNLKK